MCPSPATSNAGAVAGGVIGALLLIVIIIAVAIYCFSFEAIVRYINRIATGGPKQAKQTESKPREENVEMDAAWERMKAMNSELFQRPGDKVEDASTGPTLEHEAVSNAAEPDPVPLAKWGDWEIHTNEEVRLCCLHGRM